MMARIASLLIAMALSLSAAASAQQVEKVGLPLGDEADPYGPAVAEMVRLMAEYSQWQGAPKNIRVCVVGEADHVDGLKGGRLSGGRRLLAARSVSSQVRPDACEIVYLGRLSLAEQRTVTDRMRGHSVLTIAENDPACRSRSMFCLLFQSDSLSFRLNIDAVSRSLVRIDPRVLRMGLEDGS